MNTEFSEKKEIELINSIIREAIVHGSDNGGAYEINEDGLRESVSEWLEYHDLSEKYTLRKFSDGWNVMKLCRNFETLTDIKNMTDLRKWIKSFGIKYRIENNDVLHYKYLYADGINYLVKIVFDGETEMFKYIDKENYS
jgi:hypothetical protein